MKRKVIKQGNGTLTITLPKQWTNRVGLKGGDEIDISEREKSGLLINLESTHKSRSIRMNIKDNDVLRSVLGEIYGAGYDKVIINLEKEISLLELDKVLAFFRSEEHTSELQSH